VGELPARAVGLSVVEKLNPLSELPAAIWWEEATHSMAEPSKLLPLPVMELAQPVGLAVALGTEGRKSSPGTHENQNVPILVVPVSVTLMS
jgi:hypothetical protein